LFSRSLGERVRETVRASGSCVSWRDVIDMAVNVQNGMNPERFFPFAVA
jgi:hypothetical protein